MTGVEVVFLATVFFTVGFFTTNFFATAIFAVGFFAVGSFTAFVSAFICVRWLLRYIISHDFTVFAWYRIIFGLVILATVYTGALHWPSP